MPRIYTLVLGKLLALALLSPTPLLLAQDANKQPARLRIFVPTNATVEIEGVKTKQTGEERTFVSPALEVGKKYVYTVKATWTDAAGEKVVKEEAVRVTGGQETVVDLRPSVVNRPADKGRPRLDAVFVASPPEAVDKMLEMANVTDQDTIYDLGCGDGRILIAAAKKYQAKGVGIELDPLRVKDARDNVKKSGVDKLVTIREENFFKTADLDKATVVTLYLLPDVNEKLLPIVQKQCKPGTRIVSLDFRMGDWKPAREETVKDREGQEHTVFLWDVGQTEPKKEEKKAEVKKEIEKKEEKKEEASRPRLDVPFLPTPDEVVDKMLELAKVTDKDVVYDLGCGDGRIVVVAAKRYGAHGVGIDLNPERVKDSLRNVKKHKVEKLVEIREGDALKVPDLDKATVITLYLLPEFNEKLMPILKKQCKPGTRIVSHDFGIGNWKPLKEVQVKDNDGDDHDLYLWIIGQEAKAAPPEAVAAPDEVKKDKKPVDREPDVIYLPTPQAVVEKMLELAEIKKDDVVYDLGCGDARIPVTAAKKYGVKTWGFDIDPERIKDSLENVKKNKVEKLVTIEKKDIFTLDLSKANVVTLYLLPRLNVQLIPQLEKLPKGSRIVSHDFDMKGVKPDKVIKMNAKDDDGIEGEHTIYLWTTPLQKEKEEKRPDVVYVPTPQAVVDKMLEMAEVTKKDIVWDLGCGDARIPVTAAKKFGCKARGFDVDPDRIKDSNENVKKNKVEDLVKIEQKDIFTLDLSKEPTVITLYLLPRLNVKLIPQLEKLPKGSRIVSHDFDMEGVKPDKVVTMKAKDDRGNENEHTIYLWTVPLKKEK
jgi:uncharacterized protein (TIGR03000 family)